MVLDLVKKELKTEIYIMLNEISINHIISYKSTLEK